MKESFVAMRRTLFVVGLLAMLGVSTSAQAGIVVWNFTNSADYYISGDTGTSYMPVITPGVGAYVPARPHINSDDDPPYGSDFAAVFAKINTQAPGLKVDDILGGGFTLTGMNNPTAVYGSLYLSPTGGSGATVMINMSPMGMTAADGSLVYTFDINTPADVKIKNGSDGSWGTAQTSGTFGGAIDWIDTSAYSGTYAAFFGPQIGMSNTSGTTFTVTEIELNTVPDGGATLALLGCALVGLGALRRKFRA
jgi:hypothetical protein